MKFSCSTCMFVYDETIGEESMGIKPGTYFYELAEDFYCPVCNELKESFGEIEEEINYPLNYDNLTGLESEHFPIFLEKNTDSVKLQIGEKIHANTDHHYIAGISIFDEYNDLIEEKILLPTEEPIVDFDIDASEIYEIRINCNTHNIFGRKIKHD